MRIIILALLIIVVILYLITRFSESSKKGPPNTGYSKSTQESKGRGTFEFEVVPFKTSFAFDSSHKLKIKSAWLERGWTEQVYLFGKTTLDKENWCQLILIFDTINKIQLKTPHIYYFIGGRAKGDTLVHYTCNKTDTIRVPLYREPSKFLPSSEKRIAYDSLTFIRQ